MTKEWHSRLSPELLNRAYKESPGELAWPKSDAVKVAAMLQDQGYQILGIDAWLPTRPGPTPLIRDWDETYPMSCTDYIKTFELMPVEQSHPDLEPYFAFSVA
jgi:hypothetical protein